MKATKSKFQIYKRAPRDAYDVKDRIYLEYKPYRFFVGGVTEGGLIVSGTAVEILYHIDDEVDVYGCKIKS